MVTSAHITLLSGHGPVIEQAETIARTLHREFGYWKRNYPIGLTGTLKRPPPNFRSDRQDYAWLLVLPTGRLYERLHQMVAKGHAAYAGPREEIYPRVEFHISFQTNRNVPWDAATM